MLLVALSLACSEISILVSWLCYFFIGNTKRVLYVNVNTQNVKIERETGHLYILALRQGTEAFNNRLHIAIATVRRTLSGILPSKN